MKNNHPRALSAIAPIADRDLDRSDRAMFDYLTPTIGGMDLVAHLPGCPDANQVHSSLPTIAIRQAMFLSMFARDAGNDDPRHR